MSISCGRRPTGAIVQPMIGGMALLPFRLRYAALFARARLVRGKSLLRRVTAPAAWRAHRAGEARPLLSGSRHTYGQDSRLLFCESLCNRFEVQVPKERFMTDRSPNCHCRRRANPRVKTAAGEADRARPADQDLALGPVRVRRRLNRASCPKVRRFLVHLSLMVLTYGSP